MNTHKKAKKTFFSFTGESRRGKISQLCCQNHVIQGYSTVRKIIPLVPILVSNFLFFGTKILHKLSLNQSNNNLGVTFPCLVEKIHTFSVFGKVVPRIGTLLWVLLEICPGLPLKGIRFLEIHYFFNLPLNWG